MFIISWYYPASIYTNSCSVTFQHRISLMFDIFWFGATDSWLTIDRLHYIYIYTYVCCCPVGWWVDHEDTYGSGLDQLLVFDRWWIQMMVASILVENGVNFFFESLSAQPLSGVFSMTPMACSINIIMFLASYKIQL